MPSRSGVVLILLFWLTVTAYVVRREVLPRFFADTPPRVRIELVDELSAAPTNWTIFRVEPNGSAQKIGTMTSRTEYVAADDTFRFNNTYRGLKYDLQMPGLPITVEVPTGVVVIRVDREGRLREQSMSGKFEVGMSGLKLASADTDVTGTVQNGQLVGRAKLTVPGVFDRPFDEELKPVPATDGQVLNPMMPVDRLEGVVPGRRWAIRQTNPMDESLDALVRGVLAKNGMNSKLLPSLGGDQELLAEVLAEPEFLTREGAPVACWVIRYESADKQRTAKTYVRQENGQVLRQEAGGMGNTFRIDRDE
jgi:hypothetical protein